MKEARRLNQDTQAGRIIQKFGGIRKCWECLRCIESLGEKTRGGIPSVPGILYRWTYPTTRRGTGGLIPAASVPYILAAAKYFGIELTADDWYPRTAVESIEEGPDASV